jgi:hypothetical protein
VETGRIKKDLKVKEGLLRIWKEKEKRRSKGITKRNRGGEHGQSTLRMCGNVITKLLSLYN